MGKFLFAVLILVSAYLLRQFENLWALVIVALMLLATFLIQKIQNHDQKLVRYVKSAHWIRLLLFGSALVLFLGFLSGLTLYGTYLHLVDFSWEGSTYIQGNRSGKSLPQGHYAHWVLTLLIGTFALFFCTIFYSVLLGGVKGLKQRTQKKRRT